MNCIIFEEKEKNMLSKKLPKPRNSEKGFTLIELIIVIVILGVIAGVAIPQFIGLSDDARLSAARGVGGSLSGTIASLHADYLINDNDYDADAVIANTQFAGGVTVVNAGGILTFTSGPNDYTWTYNARVDEASAFLTELAGF